MHFLVLEWQNRAAHIHRYQLNMDYSLKMDKYNGSYLIHVARKNLSSSFLMGPDRSVARASVSGAVDHRFTHPLYIKKAIKMVLAAPLQNDARNKG